MGAKLSAHEFCRRFPDYDRPIKLPNSPLVHRLVSIDPYASHGFIRANAKCGHVYRYLPTSRKRGKPMYDAAELHKVSASLVTCMLCEVSE